MRISNVAGGREPTIAALLNESEAGSAFESSRVSPGWNDAALLDEYSRTDVTAAARVGPAAVNIDIKQRPESQPGPREDGGSASGVVSAPDGFILTNTHVLPAENG